MIAAIVLAVVAVAPKQLTVKADDGHAIAVWEKKPKGAAKGIVVLLHGRTWSALPNFDLQVPNEKVSLMDQLVERGYQVDAIDLRGYGKTPRDATGWNTPERAVADISAVLDSLGGKPVLFGYSMGSVLATLVAQKRGNSLSGLILYGYAWDADRPMPPQPKEPERQATNASAAAEDFIVEGAASKEVISAYVHAALASDPVKSDWRSLEQMKAVDGAKVTTPTLFIQGEKDPYATTATISKLWSKLKTADREWVTLPGTDHAAHLEGPPGAFVHVMVSFIERQRPK